MTKAPGHSILFPRPHFLAKKQNSSLDSVLSGRNPFITCCEPWLHCFSGPRIHPANMQQTWGANIGVESKAAPALPSSTGQPNSSHQADETAAICVSAVPPADGYWQGRQRHLGVSASPGLSFLTLTWM